MLVLNLLGLYCLKWAHSSVKLVFMLTRHGSRFRDQFIWLLVCKSTFFSYLMLIAVSRLAHLHRKYKHIEARNRKINDYHQRLADHLRRVDQLYSDSPERYQVLKSLADAQMSRFRDKFRQQRHSKQISEYFILQYQVPFLLKSVLSVMVVFCAHRQVSVLLLVEITLSGGLYWVLHRLGTNARVLLATICMSLWHVLHLGMVFLTVENGSVSGLQAENLFTVLLVNYYVSYFINLLVKIRFEKDFRKL